LPSGLTGVDDWSLVVVDGGSTDGGLDLVRERAPHATIVELPNNPGFAAQANAAAAADPKADLILIISRTGQLRPGCAAELMNAFDDPGVGVAVPWLLGRDGHPRPSLRRQPTLLRGWSEAVLGGTFTNRFPALSEVITPPSSYTAETAFAWASGGMTMFSRECLDAAGGWDESMFCYGEETDFELRAADAGYRLVFVPTAYSNHFGGESMARPELYAHLTSNRVRLYGKRHRRPAADLYWASMVVAELVRYPGNRPLRGAALRKLIRERGELVAGRPATHPFTGKVPELVRR